MRASGTRSVRLACHIGARAGELLVEQTKTIFASLCNADLVLGSREVSYTMRSEDKKKMSALTCIRASGSWSVNPEMS
jgi:hypothetical protein